MRRNPLITIAILSACLRCFAAAPTIPLPIPDQVAGTEYTGPNQVPGLTGTRTCLPSGQDTTGLQLESSGLIHGVLAGPGRATFSIYLVPGTSTACQNPIAVYQAKLVVGERAPIAVGSESVNVKEPQFIGVSYNGPRTIAAVGMGLRFAPLKPSAATAGLSLDADGALNGVVDASPGYVTLNACLVSKDQAPNAPCLRHMSVNLDIRSRPAWDGSLLLAALTGSPAASSAEGGSASGTSNVSPAPNVQDQTAPTNSDADLGRVRYHFTAGSVLSTSSTSSSLSGTNAAIFVDLNLDRAWRLPTSTFHPGINTYFDSRLTSVPTQSTSTGTNQTSNGLSTFVNSQKAGAFQIGMYLPFRVSPWEENAKQPTNAVTESQSKTTAPAPAFYSMFLAPLAKVGFVTQLDNSNAAAVLPLTGRFYTQYAYGTRLGVWKDHKVTGKCKHDSSTLCESYDPNIAPEIISYVDIAIGRFGNFASYRDLTTEGTGNSPASTDNFAVRRLYRYSFEGILKLPNTPIVLGFNANIGAQGFRGDPIPGSKNVYPYSVVRDDLRFLIGAQFDVTQVVNKLKVF